MRAGAQPGPVARWVAGARPRTLPAAVVPVLVGTAAVRPASISLPRLALAAVVALGMQVGTNYANDYSDGRRGTDDRRVGPVRLVGQGLASPGAVRSAALASFAVAAAAGLALSAMTTFWLVPFGIAAVVAGWLYTGGPKPYGYLGLGELFVFAFFGLLATAGSAYVQHRQIPAVTWPAAVAVGLLATALLEANNLRDMAGDEVANKRTLAVRLGRRRAGWLDVGIVLATAAALLLCGVWRPWAPVAILGLAPAIPMLQLARSDAEGRELLPMLPAAARSQLLCGLLLAVALYVG